MNDFFKGFVAEAQTIASAKGLTWAIKLDSRGVAADGYGWNLTVMSGASPPPTYSLRDLGVDRRTFEILRAECIKASRPPIGHCKTRPLSPAWQDLIKAAVIDQLAVRRNTPAHVLANVVRPLRALASCAGTHEPWELTIDDVSLAFETAKSVQPSGKLGDLVFGVVATILDSNYLVDAGPLSPALTRNKHYSGKRARFVKSADELRSGLEERRHAEKLPERRAFWELVRIVFTEQPKSFLDYLRFALIQLILLTGLRVGEAALLPADWKRFREYYDPKGRPAGELGGISRSLMLRHFGEKSRTANEDSLALFETTQHVPQIFEEILTETLDQVASLTAPLRHTLKRQVETGRILPDFGKEDRVCAIELYTYLTGNPFILDLPRELKDRFISQNRANYDAKLFDDLRVQQLQRIADKRSGALRRLNVSVYQYMRRLRGLPFCTADGGRLSRRGNDPWDTVYFRISEVEQYLATELASKLSDSTPLKLAVGELPAYELMFLAPKRALSEGRDEGLLDISRYYAVGRMDASMVTRCISSENCRTLFADYGQTDEDRGLTLNPHSLRHLQNTELFRLGVADTIITKRFNRRSVAQSYEYDHRTLAEELTQIDLPDADLNLYRAPKTSTLARLIQAGKATGPIVDAFRRIQRSEGEAAAFDFLRAEADGFHATPYGYCINSFTVDPCPKHLECFSGCRHLTATNLPEHTRNLVQIQNQLRSAIQAIEARPSKSIGRANQLQHAQVRLEGVQKLLAAPTGARVFPQGPDLAALPSPRRSVLDAEE